MTRAVFRTTGIRAIEQRAAAAATPPLMERAGAIVAETAVAMIGADRRPLLILAGPGNNGGDGFVVARRLRQQGLEVLVVFAGEADRLPSDARAALDAWQAAGGTCAREIPALDFALVIDALFGIGLTRPVAGRPAALIDWINRAGRPVLAVDIPSGLDADSGCVLGHAVRATRTVSFIAGKPGLLTADGPDHCGELSIHDLGLDSGAAEGEIVSTALFAGNLKPRPGNSHKGSFGNVGILGGAPGMAGAALLAGRAALKLGTGRVYLGMLDGLAVDPVQPELMLRAAEDVFAMASVLAVGPGLGQSPTALALLDRATEATVPLILDADALNLLAAHPDRFTRLPHREAATLLTPHPAEAARLLGSSTAAIQADRLAAALGLATATGALVVLKGCGSVIACPDGHWFINTSGNPGLASAGSGDVLTGMIAALMAQHWPARDALLAAVHLHGCAADTLVAAGDGPVGLTAGELIDPARRLLNRWIANV